jgi:N-acyl-D-aspartate/D-glutamate deacylase
MNIHQMFTRFLLLLCFLSIKGSVSAKDILIRNVRLIDGTGAPAHIADVRFRGDRIIAVGALKVMPGDSIVDGRGQVLAPGFIDSHSHHLGYLRRNPDALATASQGITTIVIGQDGDGLPMDSLRALFSRARFAVNIASYTGHTMLRSEVMGDDDLNRPARDAELVQMRKMLAREMMRGSLGLSTGLEYEGAFYSSRSEVVSLARVAAEFGGRYISHIRSEDLKMDDAVEEIIEIGRLTGMPVKISHIKLASRDAWGQAPRIISRLEQARAAGIDITADAYPYTFWNSTLRVLFPDRRYSDTASARLAVEKLCDPDSSMLVRYLPEPAWEGRMLGEIARMRGASSAQTLLHLVARAEEYARTHPDADGVEAIAGKSMTAGDVADFLAWPHTNICSDGNAGRHPRGFGAFTRVLGRQVRESRLMSLETAVHKMTALTARHLGIRDRGLIRPGYLADLVLFDPDRVIDRATLEDSHALSDGIISVWVNGKRVYDAGRSTGIRSGRLVTRTVSVLKKH